MKQLLSVFAILFSMPVALATVSEDTPLVSLKGKIQIALNPAFTITEFSSPIIGDRTIIHFREGLQIENETKQSYKAPGRYNSFSNADLSDLEANGPICWITLGNYNVRAGSFPINGGRVLRVRQIFEPWLSHSRLTDVRNIEESQVASKVVVASFLRDPQLMTERGPQVESIFCTNGQEAKTFTVGDLKKALGSETIITIK